MILKTNSGTQQNGLLGLRLWRQWSRFAKKLNTGAHLHWWGKDWGTLTFDLCDWDWWLCFTCCQSGRNWMCSFSHCKLWTGWINEEAEHLVSGNKGKFWEFRAVGAGVRAPLLLAGTPIWEHLMSLSLAWRKKAQGRLWSPVNQLMLANVSCSSQQLLCLQ